MSPYWSYVLTAVGVFGLWLAGRHDTRGWLVGLAAQVLWITYAVATRQWGFIAHARTSTRRWGCIHECAWLCRYTHAG